jgi:hypothetical protein
MRKVKMIALGLCLVLALASTASANSSLNIGILKVNGHTFNIQGTPTANGYDIFNQNFGLASVFSANFGGSVDFDPSISLSLGFSNLTAAPIAVSFIIGPFFGIGSLNAAELVESNSGSLGDAGGPLGRGKPNGKVYITPDPAFLASEGLPGGFIQTNLTETNIWQVNPGFPLVPITVIKGFTVPFGAYNLDVLNQPGPNLDFEEAVGFILSPGDDLSMTLFSGFTPVPVPPTALLLGSGLLGLGLFNWRRKRS